MCLKRNYNLQKFKEKAKETLISSSLDGPLCCSAGVFIGAGGSRVPVKLSHEIGYSASSTLPRKRGLGRVSAAIVLSLATRFRAWPPLVRPSGPIRLDLASRLFNLKFRDNLRNKLT